jgi:polysaccharide pyruvyl transferase WcaK-like protein/MoaA/NifB/PqqE/SkfB family radical SAM enzyme
MRLLHQLRFRWWEWSDANPAPRQRLPTALQFPVNDICNSQCQMCHIWQRKRDHDVTPAEVAAILENPLFREVRDVGVNGGEPTLRRDLVELVQVLIDKLPRLRGVSLITNAIQENQVVRAAEEAGRRCREAGVHFSAMVSIDGVGAVHDRVRGVTGNFESAAKVLDRLMASPNVGSCLIGCTLIRENIFNAEQVLAYAREKNVYARFRVGIPHRRLYTEHLRDPFDLDAARRYHLACFLDELRFNYETDPVRRAFYLSLRNQIIDDAPRTAGCVWKNRGITLTSRGELAYCAVESPALGSLLHEPADALYWGHAAVLKEINENRCARCLHDYSGVSDRQLLLERGARSLLRRLPASKQMLPVVRRAATGWRDRKAGRAASTPLPPPAAASSADPGVLICGWYGTETLGDKAILSGLLSSLRAAGWQGPVDLASLEPYVSRQTLREMPELALRSIETTASARRRIAAGAYRLVAVAGGPLMSPVAEVFDLLGLFTQAAASNTRRAVLGCGVGPLGYSKRRDWAIAQLLGLSHHTVFRDRASLDTARTRLGFSGEAGVAPDPAFIWAARQMQATPQPRRSETVLLALRDWPIREYGVGLSPRAATALKDRFEQELLAMADELARLVPDWQLRPLAMNTHPRGGDDRIFFRRLFARQPAVLDRLCWNRACPSEDFAAFRSARAVVAMRFHSAVLAIAAGTPFAAIDYTRGGKTAGLVSSLPEAEKPWPLEGFSGREFAARLVEAAQRRPPQAPDRVEETYSAAWRQALEATPS